MELAKDIPLSSSTGVIAHVMREKTTFPNGEDCPRSNVTTILLYLVNLGCLGPPEETEEGFCGWFIGMLIAFEIIN